MHRVLFVDRTQKLLCRQIQCRRQRGLGGHVRLQDVQWDRVGSGNQHVTGTGQDVAVGAVMGVVG